MPKSCITGWSRIRDIRHIRATVVMQIFCCRASKHTPWFDMQGKSLSLNFFDGSLPKDIDTEKVQIFNS
jgi:hypothetical protein